jgi:RNA polymerase sigma-70 factor (ECF subfamily)
MSLSFWSRSRGVSFDAEKIREAYETKGALVLRRCRIILQDEAAAEDVFQEVFIRLMRYGATLTSDEVPLSWLYRTAERCCFDRMRRYRREASIDPEKLSEMLAAPDIDQLAMSAEIIRKYLHKLDDKLKQVAILYYVDGLSQERIADALGWSRRTVGKKIAQLRKRAEKMKEIAVP